VACTRESVRTSYADDGGLFVSFRRTNRWKHAATLEDVRAEVLTPDRLNTLVFGGFARSRWPSRGWRGGRLAFSVSGRNARVRHTFGGWISAAGIWCGRDRGRRAMAGIGIAAGAIGGFALARLAGGYFQTSGCRALFDSGLAIVPACGAAIASMLPAARGARIDVMQALRSD